MTTPATVTPLPWDDAEPFAIYVRAFVPELGVVPGDSLYVDPRGEKPLTIMRQVGRDRSDWRAVLTGISRGRLEVLDHGESRRAPVLEILERLAECQDMPAEWPEVLEALGALATERGPRERSARFLLAWPAHRRLAKSRAAVRKHARGGR